MNRYVWIFCLVPLFLASPSNTPSVDRETVKRETFTDKQGRVWTQTVITWKAWIDGEGRVRTAEDFHQIVRAHEKWLTTNRKEGERANFRSADLYHARFQLHNLREAEMGMADLTGADFYQVNLIGADLVGANLRDADLEKADLRGTSLMRTNLSGANLRDAEMQKADLTGASLLGANFNGADLAETVFDPKENPLPRGIAHARGLGRLIFYDPGPLFGLRHSLREAGFRDAARQVTAAIQRHGQNKLELFLFDWTCEWGSDPLRPLKLVCVLSLICTVIYWVGIHFGNKSGLYLTSTGERVRTAKGKERSVRIRFRRPYSAKWYLYTPKLLRREFQTLAARGETTQNARARTGCAATKSGCYPQANRASEPPD